MSLQIETSDANDFTKQLAELDKIRETCSKLMQTKHYGSLGEAGIHAIMARAKALGIHPFEALNGGFYCINGRVGMSTEMMSALIRQRGHSVTKDPKSNNETVILHGKRADNGDVWTCTFSRSDAESAGLWNTATWKKYPGVMLYNRCMSMLFRQLFSDLSLGAGYVEDELKEITKTGDYAPQLQEASVEIIAPLPKERYPSKDDENLFALVMKKCPEDYRDIVRDEITAKYQGSISKIPYPEFERLLIAAKAKSQEEQ